MEIAEIKEKMRSQLVGTGWDNKLRLFILGSEMDGILKLLKQEVDSGYRFTPPVKDVFQPFVSCPFDSVKVVIMADCPTINPQFNDGLALSGKMQGYGDGIFLPKLRSAINEHVYGDPNREFITDLHRWAEQGVLLLNSAFTTFIETKRRTFHYDLWKPFINYVLGSLRGREDVVYILMGAGCRWDDIISDDNKKHLFPDLWKDEEKVPGSLFVEIDEHLERLGKEKINW